MWRNSPDQLPRAFDIGGMAGMDRAVFDTLAPVCWPVPASSSAAHPFADGRFSHPDGKARFVATATRAPANQPDEDYPLTLNTGRVRDQWHTMTRTGRSATLADHVAESFIDMHPQDALLHGVRAGELARVTSKWGAMVARVQHSGGIARGGPILGRA
jgi:assimilatory nitrate reductase catalytic subunit